MDPGFIMTLIAIITVSSFGVAGIGGGATFAALIVLSALDFPVALAGLLISIEPLIDMGRTALNVSGSITAGTVTSRLLGRPTWRCSTASMRCVWTAKSPPSDPLIRGVDSCPGEQPMKRAGRACPPVAWKGASMRIVIIGGEAAGMSAAAKARRLAKEAEIVVYEASEVISFGACGLPYFVGDEFQEPGYMAEFTPEQFAAKGSRSRPAIGCWAWMLPRRR